MARWMTTLHEHAAHARERVRSAFARERPWLLQVLAIALFIAFGLVGLAILLLALVIALPFFVVGLLAGVVRRTIARAHQPGGVLDQRRNVRVVVRDPAP